MINNGNGVDHDSMTVDKTSSKQVAFAFRALKIHYGCTGLQRVSAGRNLRMKLFLERKKKRFLLIDRPPRDKESFIIRLCHQLRDILYASVKG